MALIKVGSIRNFAVTTNANAKVQKPFLKGIRSFSDLKEVSRDVAPDSFELMTSTNQRGVGLKSIELIKGFDGFIKNLFKKTTNEIYFFAWAWDLSGQSINLYPGSDINAKDVIFRVKVGKVREFIGQGINLFPKRYVKGGIVIRIQLWESDQKVRNFGKVMSDSADAINKSSLNQLISAISLATGVTGTTITLIKEAAVQLAKDIGIILQSNGDDYVDFFEGYYSSDQDWTIGNESYLGNSSTLTLNKY